jgi:hypothetical protein
MTAELVEAARCAAGPDNGPRVRRGALPHELAKIRHRANAGWGARPDLVGTNRRSSAAFGARTKAKASCQGHAVERLRSVVDRNRSLTADGLWKATEANSCTKRCSASSLKGACQLQNWLRISKGRLFLMTRG